MLKTLTRLILCAVLLVLTGLGILLATLFPGFFFSFYPDFSRSALSVLAALTAITPFALCEVLGAGLVVWMIVSLVLSISRGRILRWLSGVLLWVCVLGSAFVGLWGLNYYAPPVQEALSLPQKQYTPQQLREAAIYYRDMANAAALAVERDENGEFVSADFTKLAKLAGEGFESLSEDYDCFDGSTVRVKKLLSSPVMGKIGMTGGFICLTGESCVSSTTYPVSLPFTMCHEIGHRMAFAREDEANFVAFLACLENEREDFQYSGYYNAFLYCYNALYDVDPDVAFEVWRGVSSTLAADMDKASAHYEALRDEKASEVTDEVYDTYLKSFSVKEGVQSYGKVTDLLLTWYYEVLT